MIVDVPYNDISKCNSFLKNGFFFHILHSCWCSQLSLETSFIIIIILLQFSFFRRHLFFSRIRHKTTTTAATRTEVARCRFTPKRDKSALLALFESLPVVLFKSRARFRFWDRKFKKPFQPVTAKTFDFRSSCNGRWPRRLKRPERPELR